MAFDLGAALSTFAGGANDAYQGWQQDKATKLALKRQDEAIKRDEEAKKAALAQQAFLNQFAMARDLRERQDQAVQMAGKGYTRLPSTVQGAAAGSSNFRGTGGLTGPMADYLGGLAAQSADTGGYGKTQKSEAERATDTQLYRDRTSQEADAQARAEAAKQRAAEQGAARMFEASEGEKNRANQRTIAGMRDHGPAAPKLKVAPMGAIKDYNGILSIQNDLADLGRVMESKEGQNAVGMKNVLPDMLIARTDPQGIKARSLLSNFSSLTFLERSGAAVTPSEAERLKPYTINATDNAQTVKEKLKVINNFLANKRQLMEDSYNEDLGYQPLSKQQGQPSSDPERTNAERAIANGANPADVQRLYTQRTGKPWGR